VQALDLPFKFAPLPTSSQTERKYAKMAQRAPVHVEPRENGWAVVRQDHKRASSVHPTQAEAAKEGRNIARREATEFFLHAQDGRVREHRDYGEGSRPADRGVVDQAAGTVTGKVSAAVQALGAVTGSTGAAESEADPRVNEPGSTASPGSNKGTSSEETSDTEEVHGLSDARNDDSFGTPEERYASYEVYDQDGEKIGRPDDLFVDENDNPEYVGVRTNPLGTSSVLIPADVITLDDGLRHMRVSRPKSVVDAGPSLEQDEELTPHLEERVRDYYGLTSPENAQSRGGYGTYYPSEERASTERTDEDKTLPGAQAAPFEAGEPHTGTRDHTDLSEPDALEDEDELRIRRSEEELRVGTSEREAGVVRVRKRVRTDRERVVVPKKRVEVTVERVPVEEEVAATMGEAARPEIGEDEIVVPVVEEEVVVEKRPVVKEEIRIRKEVVEETEVVEEDVRREEIEVDDETERDNPAGGPDPARGR
jgi:uncharacterized protein (TIGR02271 family)